MKTTKLKMIFVLMWLLCAISVFGQTDLVSSTPSVFQTIKYKILENQKTSPSSVMHGQKKIIVEAAREKFISLNVITNEQKTVNLKNDLPLGTKLKFELGCPAGYFVYLFAAEINSHEDLIPGSLNLIFPVNITTNPSGTRQLRCVSGQNLMVPNQSAGEPYFSISKLDNGKIGDKIFILLSRKKMFKTQEDISILKMKDLSEILSPFTTDFNILELLDKAAEEEGDINFPEKEIKALFPTGPALNLFYFQERNGGAVVSFTLKTAEK